MNAGLSGFNETSARISRIKLALIEGIDGLEKFEQTGEYDNRLELFETVTEDLPESRSGIFPPLDRESIGEHDIDDVVEDLEYLSRKTNEMKNSENTEEFDINQLSERAREVYEKLDNIEQESRSSHLI